MCIEYNEKWKNNDFKMEILYQFDSINYLYNYFNNYVDYYLDKYDEDEDNMSYTKISDNNIKLYNDNIQIHIIGTENDIDKIETYIGSHPKIIIKL